MIRTSISTPQMQAFFNAMAASTRAAASVASLPNLTNTSALRAQLGATLQAVDELEKTMAAGATSRWPIVGSAK